MLIDVQTAQDAPRASRRSSRFWTPRRTTLAMLRDALDHDIVLLRGPSGAGKTSVLRQFAAELADDPTIGVQLIEAAHASPTSLSHIADAFRGGPTQHVLLIDGHDERDAIASADILDLLRDDDDLRIVAATRHVTGLEHPLAALDFDVHVIPAPELLMTTDEVADVFTLNGVPASAEAVRALTERTFGWPALAQLAAVRLRLEGLSMRTGDQAEQIAAYARATFTSEMERRLCLPVTDDLRLIAVAPYVTVDIAEAIGIASAAGSSTNLLSELQDAGLVWPSSTRLVLAEPVRDQWLREISASDPELVEATRLKLLDHLVATGEALLAGELAADAGHWTTLARILRSSGAEIWAHNGDVFDKLIAALRTSGAIDPVSLDALVDLDPRTATSSEKPAAAVAALGRLPEAKSAAGATIEVLLVRVNLLRAAGRFTLASETATSLLDALRRQQDPPSPLTAEAWYQVGMTHLAAGKIREAGHALDQSQRWAAPAQRLRAQGVQAMTALLEGDIPRAAAIIAEGERNPWASSPWGEPRRLARAWLQVERGDAAAARAQLETLASTEGARELWPFAAAVHALSLLCTGSASDALGLLRTWSFRSRSMPPSSFHTAHMLTTRAKVLIAVRQARKAVALFEASPGPTAATAPAIALSDLYAGRTHESYVMSVKWALHHDLSPRAALESLVVSIVADLRLNGSRVQRSAVQRAEALSLRYELWSPWSAVAPEDRAAVTSMLSAPAREAFARRGSFFASSVSVPYLTKREQIVLAQLTPTSTIAEIAHALVVSPNTVKTQLQSLYRKLDVSDRSSAIRAAHAWGLIEADTDL